MQYDHATFQWNNIQEVYSVSPELINRDSLKLPDSIKRDSLRHNLTTKYNAILNNYATELDNIQRVFTD